MPERIRARIIEIAPDCRFGPDVQIEADEVRIGPGCRIGFSGDDDSRTPAGVLIRAERLELERDVRIGRSVRAEGGYLRLGEGVRIERGTTIRVLEELRIGAFGTVHSGCEISGRQVEVGQELWMLPGAKIGGGSAFERTSRLKAGHFLHLGLHTLVNTARPVEIGHEVGLGTRTSIYTHGAYPSQLMGFPVAFAGVSIGDFTWVPGAIINPGVRIGRNCVIGVNSVVTKDIPDGSLAAGSPAEVLRASAYPRPLEGARLLDFYAAFLSEYADLLGATAHEQRDDSAGIITMEADGVRYVAATHWEAAEQVAAEGDRYLFLGGGISQMDLRRDWTIFDTTSRYIRGTADAASARLTNELRRHGIRFYSRPDGDSYLNWEPAVPSHTEPRP